MKIYGFRVEEVDNETIQIFQDGPNGTQDFILLSKKEALLLAGFIVREMCIDES